MDNWKKFFNNFTFRLIDHSEPESLSSAIESFAIDDALATDVGSNESPATIRFWIHDQTVVLGIGDAKLPYLIDGINGLHDQGYQVVVRNSGGLAVALDSGVLNLSLILPNGNEIGIHEGYEVLVQFIKYVLADLTNDIEVFEVKGSYCPGDYDLSIDGKKFAGISQRRVKNGVAVQIYLCIEGDGTERARLISDFYQRGLKGETGKFVYPEVKPETMKSLTELLHTTITVADMKTRIIAGLESITTAVEIDHLTAHELVHYEKRLEQMKDRNKKALGDLA